MVQQSQTFHPSHTSISFFTNALHYHVLLVEASHQNGPAALQLVLLILTCAVWRPSTTMYVITVPIFDYYITRMFEMNQRPVLLHHFIIYHHSNFFSSSIVLSHWHFIYEYNSIALERCINGSTSLSFSFFYYTITQTYVLETDRLRLDHSWKSHSDKIQTTTSFSYALHRDSFLIKILYSWITVTKLTPALRSRCFSNRQFESDYSTLTPRSW